MNNLCYPFVNTPLGYEYDALEPFIDEKTMRLHHNRHLQAYIDQLNVILEKHPALQKSTLKELLLNCCRLPDCVQIPIHNNAGGVYNHWFFFDSMGAPGCKNDAPSGCLAEAIHQQFGCFEHFKAEFKKEALSVFGSGCAWLVMDRCCLKIVKTANQDTPFRLGVRPILTLDVWEHAYYLKHYNVRAAYVDDWFQVVSWNKVEQRFCENIVAVQQP